MALNSNSITRVRIAVGIFLAFIISFFIASIGRSVYTDASNSGEREEDYRAAAKRELDEETGFQVPIGPFLCARSEIFAVARSAPARWLERYYLVQCEAALPPNCTGWTDEEQDSILLTQKREEFGR